MKNLYRLIYTSARSPYCEEDDIQDILHACQTNNTKKDITGILIHTERRFLQYLEGEKEEIEQLYNHIQNDPRHGGCNQRAFGPIDERLFPTWSMGYKDADSLHFDSVLAEKDAEIFRRMVEGMPSAYTDRGMGVLKTFFKVA